MNAPVQIDGARYLPDGSAIVRVGDLATLDLDLAGPGGVAQPLTGRFFVQRLLDRDDQVLASCEGQLQDTSTVRFTLPVQAGFLPGAAKAVDLRHVVVELLDGDVEDPVLSRPFSVRQTRSGSPDATLSVGDGGRVSVKYAGQPGLNAAETVRQAGLIETDSPEAFAEWAQRPAVEAKAAADALIVSIGHPPAETDMIKAGLSAAQVLSMLIADPTVHVYASQDLSISIGTGTNQLNIALAALRRLRLSGDARLTINLPNVLTDKMIETSGVQWDHPQIPKFKVTGPSAYSFTINGVNAVTLAGGVENETGAEWDVVYNVTPATGSSLTTVSTNHQALVRAAKGRRAWIVPGLISTTALSPTLTGANTALDNRYFGLASRLFDAGSYLQPIDVLVGNAFASVDRSAEVTGFSGTVQAPVGVAVTNVPVVGLFGGSIPKDANARGKGAISFNTASTTVLGVGTQWLSDSDPTRRLNVGDYIFAYGGQVIEVVAVTADDSFTARVTPTRTATLQNYAIKTNYERLEGGWRIVAVDAANGRITLRHKTRSGRRPPLYGVSGGTIRVVRSVIDFTQATPGYIFPTDNAIGFLDLHCLRGSGLGVANTDHGLSFGRDPEDEDAQPIQAGSGATMGTTFMVCGFKGSALSARDGANVIADFFCGTSCGGPAIASGQGSYVQARHSTLVDCLYGGDALHGGTIYLEDSLIHGCINGGTSIGPNSFIFCNGLRELDAKENGLETYGGTIQGNSVEVSGSYGNNFNIDGGSYRGEHVLSYAAHVHGFYCRIATGSEFKRGVSAGNLTGFFNQEGLLSIPVSNAIANKTDGVKCGYLGDITQSGGRSIDNGGYGYNLPPNTCSRIMRPNGGGSNNALGISNITPNALPTATGEYFQTSG